MILFSVVAGIAAVVLAARWVSQQTGGTVKVVVASRDINLGTVLDPTLVHEVAWPAGNLPKGAVDDIGKLTGRVIKTAMSTGELVLESKLAPEGTKGGLSAVIGEGKRAITVKVNEVIGVAGFALPGNYVDVMVNTRDEGDKPVSKIVLERMLVLAVAQEASQSETKPKVVSAVTLEVSPEEAEKLDLARSVGTLSLVLRNQIDKDPTATVGARKGDLLRNEAPAPVPTAKVTRVAPPPRARVSRGEAAPKVEVIRGVQKANADL
jgi:pilus assembly protein CpaB